MGKKMLAEVAMSNAQQIELKKSAGDYEKEDDRRTLPPHPPPPPRPALPTLRAIPAPLPTLPRLAPARHREASPNP